MTSITPDERGAVPIPPALLRQIGVLPQSPVMVEISGTALIVRPMQPAGQEVHRSSTTSSIVQTGAELIAYYQREQLIGTRSEIVDSQAHARALREAAERRARPYGASQSSILSPGTFA